MKKILLLILVLVSYVSYGQNISVLVSPKININTDFKIKKYGGIGLDIYNDKVIYDEWFFKMAKGDYSNAIFTNKRYAIGFYYITPSYKGFDISVGLGSIKYTLMDDVTYTTWDNVSGYYRSNGTYVNSYKRNVRTWTSYDRITIDKAIYGIVGISKSIRYKNNFDFIIKGVGRYIPKYGNEDFGYKFKPEIMLGVKYNF